MTQPAIHIRHATPDDARAIAQVQVETWKTAYRGVIADGFLDSLSLHERIPSWSQNLRRPEQRSFVVEIESPGVIGFATGGPEREGRNDFTGELYGLYVLPSWQRQGVGKRLVAAIVESLARSGMNTMLVWTFAFNPYRRFYERLGGKRIAEKEIEIGEQKLVEVAFGWKNLDSLTETNTD